MFQISTLVAHRERPFCTERTAMAIARVGQGVNLAIERFVTVGETIADDNPEIKADMYHECKEARAAGESQCGGRCLNSQSGIPSPVPLARAKNRPTDFRWSTHPRGRGQSDFFFRTSARHTDNSYYRGASKNGNTTGHE